MGWMSNFKLIFLLSAVETGATRGAGRFPPGLFGPWSVLAFIGPGLVAGFHRQHAAQDTPLTCLLRTAEVQYVCDMPLDNRRVVQIAAFAAWFSSPEPFGNVTADRTI
jgi:hypothetical protein